MTTYSDTGTPTGISFAIPTGDGQRGFTLPVQVHRVFRVLELDKQVPPKFRTPEQAERIGWRIIKDWLEAQLAIVKTEMVTFEEVMLPYMKTVEGKTMYELYLAGNLAQPALGTGA